MIENISRSKTGQGLTATVPSYTTNDKKYTVVRSDEDEWRCTCPQSFIKRVECKHIDEVKVMTRVYLDDMRAEPQLFVVKFLNITSRAEREAVVLASTPAEARKLFHDMYWRSLRILDVVPTDRKVLIR